MEELPTSFEATDYEAGANHTLRVVQRDGGVVVRVSGQRGELRQIRLGEREHKVYWVRGTDLIQSSGALASLSSGAVFRHDGRYLWMFHHANRLFAARRDGTVFELRPSDLTVVQELRGSAPADYDGRRLLFVDAEQVAVYDVATRRWQRAPYQRCR